MYLIINTAYKDKAWVALADETSVQSVVSVVPENNGHMDPLSGIQQLLKDNGVSLEALQGIMVNSGPGSFSALRSGIIVANTLSFALHIAAVGIPIPEERPVVQTAALGILEIKKTSPGSIIVPEYGREPNISIPSSNT